MEVHYDLVQVVEFKCGTRLLTALAEARDLAEVKQCLVRFDYNGTPITVYAGCDIAAMYARYLEEPSHDTP